MTFADDFRPVLIHTREKYLLDIVILHIAYCILHVRPRWISDTSCWMAENADEMRNEKRNDDEVMTTSLMTTVAVWGSGDSVPHDV